MALEDFFTLSEMKDGLVSLSRVEDLISAMNKQKDCLMANPDDAVRQWLAVSRTLAATLNRNCLEHFIHLEGLSFLNKWLQETEKYVSVVDDNSLGELVIAILASLERFPVDIRKPSAFDVGSTVATLHNHKMIDVREKAGILLEKWNNEENCEEPVFLYSDKCAASRINDQFECKIDSTKASGEKVVEMKPVDESNSTSSPASLLHDIAQFDKEDDIEDQVEHSGFHDLSDCSKEMELDNKKESNLAKSVDILVEKAEVGPKCDYKHSGSSDPTFQFKNRSLSSCSPEFFKTLEEVSFNRDFHGISIHGCSALKKIDDIVGVISDCKVVETGDSRKSVGFELDCEIDALELARQVAIEVEREVVDYREPFCSSPDDNSRDVSTDACGSDVEKGKKKDREEVGDDDDEHCMDGSAKCDSLSEELDQQEVDSRKSIGFSASPNHEEESPNLPGTTLEFEEQKEHQGKELLENEPSSVKDSSETPHISVNLDRCKDPDSESPLTTDPNNQGSAGQVDRSVCNFDLNEEAFAEGPDCSASPVSNAVSVPIAIFANSSGAPVLPTPPCHLGGLGWKGTAATSAFRSASPRRMLDPEIVSSKCKQKAKFIEIDLNVTELEEEAAARDFVAVKLEPASSSMPSGESSVEVCSRRVEKLGWDLNRLGDEDAALLLLPHFRPPYQNEGQSASPASSSSTRQPSARDFDLNDNPGYIFDTGGGSHCNIRVSSTSGSSRADDRELSSTTILGSRLPVERKVFNHTPHPFMSSRMQQLPYGQMPPPALSYGFPGLAPVSMVPIPPTFYGHGSIPYVVDSRGTTVVPQVLGSASWSGTQPPPGRPPFLMSLAGAPLGLNSVGSSLPAADLNSSTTQSGSSGTPLKRKEPERGWEAYGYNYDQVSFWP